MADVVVVDDHALIAETLRLALLNSGIEARAIVPCELPDLAAQLIDASPTLVLLDLDLGSFGDSTPLIAPLSEAGIRVLLVTGVVDRLRVAAALEQGAIGYQPKAAGFAAMLAQTSAALAGTTALDLEERFAMLDELARDRAAQARARAPFLRLTEREQHTLLALAQGRSVHEIARAWVVSEATVRSHVRGVLTKLDAPSQLAAVAIAINGGWLSPATGFLPPTPVSQSAAS